MASAVPIHRQRTTQAFTFDGNNLETFRNSFTATVVSLKWKVLFVLVAAWFAAWPFLQYYKRRAHSRLLSGSSCICDTAIVPPEKDAASLVPATGATLRAPVQRQHVARPKAPKDSMLATAMLLALAFVIWLYTPPVSPISGLLEVFQVYRPVPIPDPNSSCNEEILLLDHVFTFSYGHPFVGELIRRPPTLTGMLTTMVQVIMSHRLVTSILCGSTSRSPPGDGSLTDLHICTWETSKYSEHQLRNLRREIYGHSPFREIQLYIDGILAGVIWPHPVIFTGGVSPGFWRPIVGTDAFDLRAPEVDISPFLPLLTDGSYHSFEIKIVGLDISDDGGATLTNSIGSYWVVSGNIFLYLSDDTDRQLSTPASLHLKPEVIAPLPMITTTRDLVQNHTAGNVSLAYSVRAQRTITVKSANFTWSQNLSFSNFGLLNQQGLSQKNVQHTSGTVSAGGIWDRDPSYKLSFEYPLVVNTTYGKVDGGLTIDAWMRRGLEIDSSGGVGISTYTLLSGPLPFTRHSDNGQDGPASKRRKRNSKALSLRETSEVSASLVPNGYIPLARCNLQLGLVVPIKDHPKSNLPVSFQRITDADGENCFASQLYMIATKDLPGWYDVNDHLKGGILAEEMGLGKTVEMISLMCLNRRTLRAEETFAGVGSEGLRPTGATLIITPPVILEQWKQEIELHAPKLQVFHYTGLQRHQTLSDQELVELMADNDVVLTTYNVLAREIHYAGNAPKRNLRHEKRFEARKSPLVKISWWRVCLDEAQMIESGVSNAAKVARLIPRHMAWAVTGTPLRKDITDLLGLLLFLQYEPFCGPIWKMLCGTFKPILAQIDLIRKELHLPPQKRVVITVPFTPVEEQSYRQLFEEMCDECGLDFSGAPRTSDWDPNDPFVIERMRLWLVRLRQSCLFTTGHRRKGFAAGNGPLRSVDEVLEVMIDQNDAAIHAEERTLLLSQLRRGQLLENAKRKREAYDLWKLSLDRASEIVSQCRERLQIERKKQPTPLNDKAGDDKSSVSDDEGEETEKNTRLQTFRQRLRAALEVEHIAIFFTGNAYYQMKSDPELTEPESEEFQTLEKLEEEAYAKAKLIRQEMLTDISQRAKRYVKMVKEKSKRKGFVAIPEMKLQLYSKGLESRRVFERLEKFCLVMNDHAVQYNQWRQKMVELLSQALIDQEDDSELEGDEYEKSTKHQDEMYVYMEALRALFADRHDALTGQKNVLIAHEVKQAIAQAKKEEGPSPTLYLEIMQKRNEMKPDADLGSLRRIINELRSLGSSLEWQANEGSSRARAEFEILTMVLKNVLHMSVEQTKIASSLEKEVEMFRDTMNNRLEYYRQLQQISDTVAPYDEESSGKPLDHELFNSKLEQEEGFEKKISSMKAKGRYLIHLRDEQNPDESSKICIICQSGFEIGVLTVCGHKYCKDCLRLWWNQHRSCPVCKKRLGSNDFYQITYKPQEFVVQEEKASPNIELERHSNNAIYTDIGSGTLHEIKNIDLRESFGTKIDTLARHILWLRENDPGAQSIVFSQYRSFLQHLAAAFKRFKIGYSSVDESDGIERFKKDAGIECFLLHAKAHSSGLNLVNATHVFLCEPLINTAIELQAIARVHRIGQHRPTTVWMYLISDTVEKSIYDISVSRRLDHIIRKEREQKASSSSYNGNGANGVNRAMPEDLSEVAIDSANSLEIQDAPLAKLMEGGVWGGELVKKDDLWQCLFGNPRQQQTTHGSLSADGDVASHAVRSKVIQVCQHINTRVKAPAIKLPIAALLKQFKEQKVQLIRHFDLVYLQQGIDRLGSDARVEILVPLLQGISEIGTSVNQGAVLPPKDSVDDVNLKTRLGLSDQDTGFLSHWFSKLLLLLPAEKDTPACPGLSPAEYKFLNKNLPVTESWNPAQDGGLNLTETKVRVLRFISSGAFNTSERLMPAIIASADSNSRLFIPDLENPEVVQQLYQLYFGSGTPDGPRPARSALQTKLLVFLGKILQLIEDGLLSDTARSSQGLQASKLRTQIFNFTTWVMAPKVIAGLMDFIRSQGWPSSGASGQRLPATDLSLRALAYESIGIIVPRADLQFNGGHETVSYFELIKWLFTSLSCDDSGSQIFVSIEQALGSILNSSIDVGDTESRKELSHYLDTQMRTYPGNDDEDTGCRIVRGPQYAAVRFANRFLPFCNVLARWIDLMAVAGGSDNRQEISEEGKKGLHPYWFRLINPTQDNGPIRASFTTETNSYFDFPSFYEATNFLLFTVEPGSHEFGVFGDRYRNSFGPAMTFLRNILFWESLSAAGLAFEIEQDWEPKLDLMLSTDEKARAALRQHMKSNAELVGMFLQSTLMGLVDGYGEGRRQCGEHFVSICSLATNNSVEWLLPQALSLKGTLSSNDQDAQNTAARAIGILTSHPAFFQKELNELVMEWSATLASWESAVGGEVLRVRGALLALSFIFSRLAFRGTKEKISEAQVNALVKAMFTIIETSRDSLLRQAAQVAIAQLSLSGLLSPTTSNDSEWETVKGGLVKDAKAESSVAITALGSLVLNFPHDAPQFQQLLDALYGLHELKSPEIHFTIGEALGNAVAGWNSKSLIPDFDVDASLPQNNIPTSVLADASDKLIADCRASKPSLKKASAIWLLCLVKNCGHMEEVQSRLRKCQITFASLLSDRDEMVQETGAQGLSLVYEMGDQSLKDDLVRDLVDSFTASSANLGGGAINENTELFEPGALPTGGGSSVNTYKDIMNLASEAGDPTLVYRFMSLASNNALWTSGAAFSKIGISSIFSDSSVNGYLAKNTQIYPKLFRYRFDPNPNVQRSMNTIWLALVKDPNAVLTAHFDEILTDLLKSMLAGREWRMRQASCAAIADLIQGRQPDVYSKYVDEIFAKAFKLVDDIKESVRIAALKLCQTITGSVLRTLEASDPDTKRVRTMLESTIPFLLSDKGMESSVQEVQGFALSALIQMIKKGPGSSLRPFVPSIMEQFLNCLSSLEPQAVNYVHLNADKYGLTGQEIDKMRLSSIRTSPMMEVIERYLIDMLDDASMKEFAAKLEGVLRSAVGLPSKVGCSRVLVLLSMRSVLFQPYADRFIQLLGKYVVDRNDTVSASYCSSIGYLMRLASDDRILKTIEHAKTLYLQAEDANQRVISAEILHASSKLSNDRFMAFASTALPFHVREVFEKTWQDNEIADLVSGNLDSARWAIKHTAALAIGDAIIQYLWPVLERALAGKTWDGKENVLKAFVRQPQLGELMKTITIREAKRNNPAYRPHGLTALGGVAQARKDLNLTAEAISIVSKVLDGIDDAGDPMDIDSGSGPGAKQTLENTLAACVKCLLQCFSPAVQTLNAPSEGRTDLDGYMTELKSNIRKVVKHGEKQVQISLYEELRLLFTQLTTWASEGDGQTHHLREMHGLLATLAGELSCEIDLSVEAIRRGRAEATSSYVRLCLQAEREIDPELRKSIGDWRKEERSGPVRQVLDQVIGQLTPEER
ncbi:proteasome stabiliser-domain-containing protein [Aspergillus undulatus]|uniref:proteasome stabiliser-domain-containing protein n=1 Tax=Aspergillus undulatus TaxID=1810928 RepID=UPI003CCD0A9F